MANRPDRWVIVKITNEDGFFYKVFATWLEGYLDEGSWKINSGISRVEEDDSYLKFFGHSGSCYECPKIEIAYGTNYYTQTILDNIISKAIEIGHKMEIMPSDTNWKNLINLEK